MTFLKSTSLRVLAMLEGTDSGVGNLNRYARVPWIFPIGMAVPWLQKARSLVGPLMRNLMVRVSGMLVAISEETAKVTPQWEHVITDSKLHVALAKRSILQWKARASLNTKAVALNHSIVDFCRVHTTFGLAPKITEDEFLKGPMHSASIAFAKAKAAIEVTAILNVLYERTGSEQSRAASYLLSKFGGTMPAVLKVELETLT